ncbi:MAG: hypothetical protein Kow0047_24600 [Anaerolineae bacterium]
MLQEIAARGLNRCLVDPTVSDDELHIHITEVGPGERAHPPHTHSGIEAFYILQGEGTLEIGEERYPLKANESAIFRPGTVHGLVNTGSGPLRYMVIIRR